MITVFTLFVYMGLGEDRKLVHKDMLFESLVDCQWYASRIVKMYGSTGYRRPGQDIITAYCLPKEIQPGTARLY